jgi:hypothetical protein
MSSLERTRPSEDTQAAEQREARAEAGADRGLTAEEEAAARDPELDPEVARHHREMDERGARQKGEGRIP